MLNQPLILKPSYLLSAFLLCGHVGAIIAVTCLSLSWLIILPLSLLVIVNLIINLRCYALQLSPKAIVKIFPKKDEWLLEDKQGHLWQAKLAENSFRSLHVVILNFKLINTKRKMSVIILPDSLEKNSFRRLRGQLLIG